MRLRSAIILASLSASGLAVAGPEGGEITGGEGNISVSGNTTQVDQHTQRMIVEWQSYNLATDERVNYLQPSSSALALNLILSNSGSEILGRIDANGQVMLVNPNGIIFGESAVVNAGGILASGLHIDPNQFMNGNYTFSARDGTDGVVINSGLLNAATGGSVSLLGRRVENHGLIQAGLGRVNMAAANEAVLTFDHEGLIGIQVTESVLQEELGLEAAVINSGVINAEGGQVLLTAAASRDVFSSAVNIGNEARSVVVEEDGSFTLSSGANVELAGEINAAGGDVVALGQNVTSSASIRAGASEQGGRVELHSVDTTSLINNSLIDVSGLSGEAGQIKLFGTRVGLFDNTKIIANAAMGGGEVYVGGDYLGENLLLPNASAVYMASTASINADAFSDGGAGKIILWGSDLLRAYGSLSAFGFGDANGGFIETSSKVVYLDPLVRVGSEQGAAGLWLIDPYNVNITDGANVPGDFNGTSTFTSGSSDSTITTGSIETALSVGSNGGFANIQIQTGNGDGGVAGNITLTGDIEVSATNSSSGRRTLTLSAHNDINIQNDITFTGSGVNLVLQANGRTTNDPDSSAGDITFNSGLTVSTGGGNFTASGIDFTSTGATINVSNSSGGGNITISNTGDVAIGALRIGDSGNNANGTSSTVTVGNARSINVAGDVTFGGDGGNNANDHTVNVTFTAADGVTLAGDWDDGSANNDILNLTVSANANNDAVGNLIFSSGSEFWPRGFINVTSAVDIELNDTQLDTEVTNGYLTFNASGNINGDDAILIVDGVTTIDAGGDVSINNILNNFTGAVSVDANNATLRDANSITLSASTIGTSFNVTAQNGNITDSGTLVVGGAASFVAQNNSVTLDSANNNFSGAVSVDATSATLVDVNSIQLGNITTTNTLNVTASGGISQSSVVSDRISAANATFTVGNDSSIILDSVDINGLPDNIFTNTPQFSTSSGTILNLTVLDSTDITLQDQLTVTGNLTVAGQNVVFNRVAVGNNLTATANGSGTITDNDNRFLTVTGTSTLTARNSNIALNDVGNMFTGAVTANTSGADQGENGGNITLTAASIVVGDLNSSGANATSGNTNGANAGTITVDGRTVNVQGAISAVGGTPNGSGSAGSSAAIVVQSTDNVFSDNNGTFTINPTSWQGTGFSVNGGAGDDIFNLFTGITGVTGGQGNDVYNINANNFNLTINEASDQGTDTLAIGFLDNTDTSVWTIQASNSTVMNSGTSNTITFNGVETLLGGEGSAADIFNINSAFTGSINARGGNDDFVFADAGSVSGTLDGGNTGTGVSNRIYTRSGAPSILTVTGTAAGNIAPASTPSSPYVSFQNIQNISGESATGDQITSQNSTTWELNGLAANVINGINFSNFESLVGGSGADIFNIYVDLTTFTLDGRDGADQYNIRADGIAADINDSGTDGTTDAVTYTGTSSTIWNLNAVDFSLTTNGVDSVTFTGIESLVGGSAVDRFNIDTVFAGSINGAGGNDEFYFGDSGAVSGTLDGGNTGGSTNNQIYTRIGVDSVLAVSGFEAGSLAPVASPSSNYASFVNIQSVSGQAVADQVTSGSGGATWELTGPAINDITELGGVDFGNFESVVFGDGDDIFNIRSSLSYILDGRNGSDTYNLMAGGISVSIDDSGTNPGNTDVLNGYDDNTNSNIWDISASTSVTNNSGVVNFVGIENIRGGDGTAADQFDINADFAGTIHAGSGNDILNLFVSTPSATIDGGDGSDAYNIQTSGISLSLADTGTGGSDSLFAFDDNANINIWAVDSSTSLTNSGATIGFSGIENLRGGDGSAADQFIISANFDGNLYGGLGNDIFILSASAPDTTIDGGDGNDVYNISSNGVSATISDTGATPGNLDTLNAFDDSTNTNTWDIDGTPTLSNNGGVIGFSGIDVLHGGDGAAADIFNILTAFTGEIQGGSGADTFNISATATTINGQNGNDRYNILADNLILNISDSGAGATNEDSIVARDGRDHSWVVNGTGSGSLNTGVTFTNIERLIGGNQQDTYSIEANAGATRLEGAVGSDIYNVAVAGATANIVEDSGHTGTDILRAFTDNTNATIWTLGSLNSTLTGSGGTITFSNIETLDGNDGVGGTFGGAVRSDVFNVSATSSSVTLNGRNGNDQFTLSADIAQANGGEGDDVFNVNSSTMTGLLVGGNGDNQLHFTLNNTSAVWDLNIDGGGVEQNTLNSTVIFRQMAHLYGGTGSDTLYGRDNNQNEWILEADDGVGGGSVGGLNFYNFETLAGGNARDIFTVRTATISALQGNGGSDQFYLDFAPTGSVSGGAGNDEFYLSDLGMIVNLQGGTETDRLTYDGTANSAWTINGEYDGLLGVGIQFTDVEQLVSGTGEDTFTVTTAAGARINNIQGGGNADRLIVQSNSGTSVTWTINGNNQGTVQNRVDNFSSIENLQGGDGADQFTFSAATSLISGLVDAGERTGGDPADLDQLLLPGYENGVVVELGPLASNSTVVTEVDVTALPNVNAHNFERIVADEHTPDSGEANNWLVINDDMEDHFYQININSGERNAGWLRQVVTLDVEDDDDLVAVTGTQVNFQNFGSFQGGGEGTTHNIIESGTSNISGQYLEGSGMTRVNLSEAIGFAVVDVRDNYIRVIGNNNTLLRITSEYPDLNGTNTWTINDANAGEFVAEGFIRDGDTESYSFTFSNINQIQGGSGSDAFNFTANGSLGGLTQESATTTVLVGGSINGGGGVDVITSTSSQSLAFGVNSTEMRTVVASYPANIGPQVEVLRNRVDIIDIAGIETLTGSSAAGITTTLYSANSGDFTWTIGANALVSNLDYLAANTPATLTFSNVDVIAGGDANDNFIFNRRDVVSTRVAGGGGVDVLNLGNLLVAQGLVVDLDRNATEARDFYIEGFESLLLPVAQNTLYGRDDFSNTWTITAANEGNVQSSGQLSFTNVASLFGGTNVDLFNVNSAGSLSGGIDGGDNDDVLQLNLGTAGRTLDLDFTGGNGTDTLIVNGGSATQQFDGEYLPASAGGASLIYSRVENAQTLQAAVNYAADVENINSNVYVSTLSVGTVSGQANELEVNSNNFVLNDVNTVNFLNADSFLADANTGDTVVLLGDIEFTGNLTLLNADLVTDNTTEIQLGGNLLLDGTNGLGTVDQRTNTAIGGLDLRSVRGSVYLNQQGDMQLLGVNMNNAGYVIDLLSDGDITSTSSLQSTSALRLDTDENIALTGANNLGGPLTLLAANGDITLNNTATNLARVSAQNLTLNVSGNVTDTGPLNISEDLAVNVTGSFNVVLDDAANAFNSVVVAGGNNVQLIDSSTDGMTASGNISGLFDLSTAGLLNLGSVQAQDVIAESTSSSILVAGEQNVRNSILLEGNGINVSAAVLVADSVASHAVNLNAGAGDLVVANDISASGALVANILLQGNNINLASGTEVLGTNVEIVAANNIVANGEVNARSALAMQATAGSFTMQGATIAPRLSADSMLLVATGDMALQEIFANELDVTSNSGSVTLARNVDVEGNASIDANNGLYLQSQVTVGAANFVSQSVLDMTSASSITSSGDIYLESGAEMGLSVLSTPVSVDSTGGTVTLLSGATIIDRNGTELNILADTLVSHSASSFGDAPDTGLLTEDIAALMDTQVSSMLVAVNQGEIGIRNTGNLQLEGLFARGNIYFGNVGNVILGEGAAEVYDTTLSGTEQAGGVVDAGYGVGNVTMSIDGYLGAVGGPVIEDPELIGRNGYFLTSGGFGFGRPLVLYFSNRVEVTGPGIRPRWGFDLAPADGFGGGENLVDTSIIGSVGDLLIELEDTSEVDPAVFTEVSNYVYEDISIRLPRDQLLEEDDKDEDELSSL